MNFSSTFSISLPEWLIKQCNSFPDYIDTLSDRMAFVLDLAEKNIQERSGGPFAAAVFETDSGKLISVGVNRVVPENCSAAHAEIVAISLAQQSLGTYNLGNPGLPSFQLAVNWRPCAMCFGAIPWSGIRQLVLCGSDDELERITGFDEGPIHPNWREELEARGISVVDNLLRTKAIEIFKAYSRSGSPVYNGSRHNPEGDDHQ